MKLSMKNLVASAFLISQTSIFAVNDIPMNCIKKNNHRMDTSFEEMRINISYDSYYGMDTINFSHANFSRVGVRCEAAAELVMECKFKNNRRKTIAVDSFTFNTTNYNERRSAYGDEWSTYWNQGDMNARMRMYETENDYQNSSNNIVINGMSLRGFIYSQLNDTKNADCIIYAR